jgi:hypothetical protein
VSCAGDQVNAGVEVPANAEDVAKRVETRPEEDTVGPVSVAEGIGGTVPAVADDEDEMTGAVGPKGSRSAKSRPIPTRRTAMVAMRYCFIASVYHAL